MRLITEPEASYDFVVVGGGTAGCAVAGRLATNPSVRILVIEAGSGRPSADEAIMTPARAFELRDSAHDWRFKTGMIDRPEMTRVERPNTRGKVLGGSSCLHYHTWIPGSAGTFDDWGEFGGKEDWSWEACREYLYKPATYHDDEGVYRPELKYIGKDGPIPVAHADLLPETREFRERLEKAWLSKGGELTDDVHGGTMRGLWKSTNSVHAGRRSSSWRYLEGKPNVSVLAHTLATKLTLVDGKAVGADVLINPDGLDGEGEKGRARHVSAAREVVVSLGVFETPKLLMLSGVGPRPELEKHGVEVVVDSPHVGQNLLDHPIMPHVFRLRDGLGLDHHLLRSGPEKDAATKAYDPVTPAGDGKKHRAGPLTSGLLEVVGLPRIDERLERYPQYRKAKEANGGRCPFGPAGQPHFEIDFVPMFADAFQWHFPVPPTGDYLTVIVDLLRPQSRCGTVKLQSTDPREQADIKINFFSGEDGEGDLDLLAMREGVRWVDDVLMYGEGMREVVQGEYPWALPRSSDGALDRQILERSQTGFHPCGTARLGRDVAQGVVDPHLRVHGLDRLRVVDASIIPVIPDCRIQNSVYMIAEKGADYIKAAHPDLYGEGAKESSGAKTGGGLEEALKKAGSILPGRKKEE